MDNKKEKHSSNLKDVTYEIASFLKGEKFQKIFYPTIYFVLTIGLVVTGFFVFKRNYYTNVYVSGSSMSPTLIGGERDRYHYGISDNHRKTISLLERFDVVVTYYPSSWGSDDSYKIKRVWGFPNETITMSFAEDTKTYTFQASTNGEVTYTITAPIEDIGIGYRVATFVTPKKTFHTHARDEARNNFLSAQQTS